MTDPKNLPKEKQTALGLYVTAKEACEMCHPDLAVLLPSDWKTLAISGKIRGQEGSRTAISYPPRKARSRREKLVSKLE